MYTKIFLFIKNYIYWTIFYFYSFIFCKIALSCWRPRLIRLLNSARLTADFYFCHHCLNIYMFVIFYAIFAWLPSSALLHCHFILRLYTLHLPSSFPPYAPVSCATCFSFSLLPFHVQLFSFTINFVIHLLCFDFCTLFAISLRFPYLLLCRFFFHLLLISVVFNVIIFHVYSSWKYISHIILF